MIEAAESIFKEQGINARFIVSDVMEYQAPTQYDMVISSKRIYDFLWVEVGRKNIKCLKVIYIFAQNKSNARENYSGITFVL